MSICVTGCRILIKPFELEEQDTAYKTAKQAGIILTDFSERKERINVDKGTVLQIGPKCHEDYTGDLKVGDIIGYAKFGGKFIKEPGSDVDLLVISDEDVICIFKEDL
jgi:co-chaperonin GroES (HSP10)